MNIETKFKAAVAAYPMKDQQRVAQILEALLESGTDLITVHFKEIDTIIHDEESLKGGFSMSFKMDLSEKKPKVSAKISYSKKYSDSVDQIVGQATEEAGATGD